MEITVTPEECESESLTDTHLKQALDAIRTEGYIVLNAVVAHEHPGPRPPALAPGNAKSLRPNAVHDRGDLLRPLDAPPSSSPVQYRL